MHTTKGYQDGKVGFWVRFGSVRKLQRDKLGPVSAQDHKFDTFLSLLIISLVYIF